ncbi:MAG: formate--tetrahydrofolate ligase, partial [Phycisphaerae bacterium]|nr:formate--tetrahydrofolate ligase [Phycisphaerae bacterium]
MSRKSVPSDIEISRAATPKPITEIAQAAGIAPDELEPYGRNKAKVCLSILDRLAGKPDGKYIDVTAITPTPLGEGRTTTAGGLAQGMGVIGKNAFLC